MPTKIEISYKTVIFTVLFLLFLWFLAQVQDIIFLVFVAFIIMSALKPLVNSLERYHVPRVLSVIFIYIFLIILIGFIGNSLIPPLVIQTIHLGESLPGYLRTVLPFVTFDISTVTQQITPFGENILKVTVSLFSNLIALFTLIVISFYLLMERKYFEFHMASFMGHEGGKHIMGIIRKMEERLGSWVRGQIALALTVGFTTFVGLTLLNIPFILPLSIFAGLLEIVPIIGPIISAIPAILVALTISPIIALATAAIYFLIQQLEAHLIVPQVMKRAVGLPPLVTIVALLIGAKLGGIGGALLAIPVVVTAQTVISEYFRLREVG